jgi:hypothetical protein
MQTLAEIIQIIYEGFPAGYNNCFGRVRCSMFDDLIGQDRRIFISIP